jgi:hypothetical protein
MDTIDRDNITTSKLAAKPGEEKKVLRAKPV